MKTTTNTTIKQLRQAGYKVRVVHNRPTINIERIDGVCIEFSPKGGTTTIDITTPDFSFDAKGIAICSDKEAWNRKIGNRIALGRAMNDLNEQISGHKNTLIV